ncbi:hypothetical protein DQ04_02711010 [Trypanosoma grayi]|uniref:hypothetical protein n=1 Tax=Trypanosoma grayi TaxID=71804 RepID=UPI0004F49C9C|nr:hypothetical protein DQ04_02711010 [Trypanosoma grayi]KEG11354.1 hypothetical protein DQ04_02711010 [Trypanosoma grayi]
MLSAAQKELQQRVQVVVRGQRFESTVEVLSRYCVLFRSFFRDALARLDRGNCSSGSSSGESNWKLCYDAAAREVDACLHRPAAEDGMAVAAASVEWSNDGSMWRFVYTATALAPEDVGVVLVYIRKLFRWSQQTEPTAPQPQLPVRWDEMPHDAQLALARVVCTFGVEPLIGLYDHPTAQPGSNSTEDDSTMKAGAGGFLLREKAEAYIRERLMQEPPNGAVAGAAESAGNGVHPSVDDDDLLLETAACSKCGVTGHTDAACPR